MFARKIVPILLVAGAVHLMLHRSRYDSEEPGLPGDGVGRSPQFRHGPFAHRRDWAKRVPPMFEMWHNRAHAAQSGQSGQAAQPSTPAV